MGYFFFIKFLSSENQTRCPYPHIDLKMCFSRNKINLTCPAPAALPPDTTTNTVDASHDQRGAVIPCHSLECTQAFWRQKQFIQSDMKNPVREGELSK